MNLLSVNEKTAPIVSKYNYRFAAEPQNEEFGSLTLRSRLSALDATYGQSPVMKGSGIGDVFDSIA